MDFQNPVCLTSWRYFSQMCVIGSKVVQSDGQSLYKVLLRVRDDERLLN